MKATGLRRVMGFVACAALISSALIAAPRASADEADLKSAFDDYAAGRYEDALKKLQTYVASNPGDDEVYRVLRQVDERVKLKALAAGGEHERHLRYLLDKARPAIEQRRRDPETIKELVDQVLSPELDVRRRASLELATKSGDYAVPYLLPHLASQDVEKVVNAIFALHAIGGEAVLPLTEALQTTDARLRGYTAVVLGDIRDPRALPMLRRVMETDEDADVKAKASAAVQKIRPIGGAASASESFVRKSVVSSSITNTSRSAVSEAACAASAGTCWLFSNGGVGLMWSAAMAAAYCTAFWGAPSARPRGWPARGCPP